MFKYIKIIILTSILSSQTSLAYHGFPDINKLIEAITNLTQAINNADLEGIEKVASSALNVTEANLPTLLKYLHEVSELRGTISDSSAILSYSLLGLGGCFVGGSLIYALPKIIELYNKHKYNNYKPVSDENNDPHPLSDEG